jgi:proline iminopeptidase
LPHARTRATHRVDIEAPPEKVWPWLVQMGRRRGGWYSWDLLDNGGKRSAERIIPTLQKLAIGDTLPITATGPDGFAVLVLEPGRALVVGDPTLLPGQKPPATGALRGTWAFSLEPMGDRATHLVVGLRLDYPPTPKMKLVIPVLLGVHDFMQRKQLRTLKKRVEAALRVSDSPRTSPTL